MASQHPAAGKLLGRLIDRLYRDLDVAGIELRSGDASERIFSAGSTATDPILEMPFSSYTLCIRGLEGELDPLRRRRVNVYRRLMDILLRGGDRLLGGRSPGEAGRISTGFLIDSFVEVLEILEDRRVLIDNYQEIVQLNQKVLVAEDLYTVLQIIMDRACRALNAESSSLLLADQKTGEMMFKVVAGQKEHQLGRIRIPSGEGIAGSVIRSAKAEIIRDVASDERMFKRVDRVLKNTTRDMAVAPILARGNVIGVLEVVNSLSPTGFLSEDLDLLKDIASHASLFIENIRGKEDLISTNQKLDRKNSEIQALYEVSRTLNSSFDPTALKEGLLRTMLRVMRIDHGSLLEVTEDRRGLHQKIMFYNRADGVESRDEPHVYADASDIMLWLKEHREPFFFNNTEQALGLANRFRRANESAFGAQSAPEMWVPIFAGDNEKIDCIVSLGRLPMRRRESASDLTFFRGVMQLAHIALRNVGYYESAMAATNREREVRRSFQKYAPDEVVRELLNEDRGPVPGQRVISVLNLRLESIGVESDAAPARRFSAMNQFFSEAFAATQRHSGVVDRHGGDGLQALFGLTAETGETTADALACARELERLLRDEFADVQAILSIHTGQALTGRLGAVQSMKFTAQGEVMRTARALEMLPAWSGFTGVLFSEDARGALLKKPFHREVGCFALPGRPEGVMLFQLLDPTGYEMDAAELEQTWTKAVSLYRQGHFNEARNLFGYVRSATREDPLAEAYMERCTLLTRATPEPGWTGIFPLDFSSL